MLSLILAVLILAAPNSESYNDSGSVLEVCYDTGYWQEYTVTEEQYQKELAEWRAAAVRMMGPVWQKPERVRYRWVTLWEAPVYFVWVRIGERKKWFIVPKETYDKLSPGDSVIIPVRGGVELGVLKDERKAAEADSK